MSKNNSFCSVPQCKSWRKRSPEITFHKFPPKNQRSVIFTTKTGTKCKLDRQKAWILKLKIGKPVTKYMFVCSLHFKNEDFLKTGATKVRHLKKDSVPNQNLPEITSDKAETKQRSLLKRSNQSDQLCCELPPAQVQSLSEFAAHVHTEEEMEVASTLINDLPSDQKEIVKSFRDSAIQVNTPQITTVCDMITTDRLLSSFTGLQNFEILNFILTSIDLVHKDKKVHRLSIKQRVMLTLMKMKTDLNYVLLSSLFNITDSLCRTYILEMIPILATVLKPAIRFCSTAEVEQNMPKCFADFKDTQIVFDGTEVPVQTPTCLCCRLRFYSHYKSGHTVKFVTGVSPAGLITFVSAAFGGRVSDKAIMEHSNILEKVEEGRAVMVDKGFHIDDMCANLNIKMYRPPFLRNQDQFTKEEAIINKKIAAARVHIERANQRIKIFKILSNSNKMQWHLVNYVEHLFIIACGITNISSPILANDKF